MLPWQRHSACPLNVVVFPYCCLQESIFTHGIFRNTVTIYGTAVSIAVMVIIVYVPFLQVRVAGMGLVSGWLCVALSSE